MTDLTTHPNSWLSPKLQSRSLPEKGGNGTYARVPIRQGELLAMFGGTVLTYEELQSAPPDLVHLSIQIDDDLYLISGLPGPGDYINHSCTPNAGLRGQVGLVAMRDIAAGEEICFDYAMCDSSPYDEFQCQCGAPDCRGRVTGRDWRDPDLWDRYDGYFSPYLQRRIDALRAEEAWERQRYLQPTGTTAVSVAASSVHGNGLALSHAAHHHSPSSRRPPVLMRRRLQIR